MYCGECGSPVQINAKFCGQCGLKIQVMPIGSETSGPDNRKGVSMIEGRSEARGPAGVYGWLFFLVAGLLVVGPLATLLLTPVWFDQMEKTYPAVSQSDWDTYKSASWGVLILAAAIGAVAGYRLAKQRTPQSVGFAKIAVVIRPIASVAQWSLAGTLLGFNDFAVGLAVQELLYACLYAGIWTAYLSRSKRVRNTYYKRHIEPLGAISS